MHTPIQEIPLRYRFRPEGLEAHEKEIIVGSLNCYGVENPLVATASNLTAFTWDQVLSALMRSRPHCKGDSLDDVDDVVYAVHDARREYDAH